MDNLKGDGIFGVHMQVLKERLNSFVKQNRNEKRTTPISLVSVERMATVCTGIDILILTI